MFTKENSKRGSEHLIKEKVGFELDHKEFQNLNEPRDKSIVVMGPEGGRREGQKQLIFIF